MTPEAAPTPRDEVLDAFRAQLRAMTDGDTDALDDLLADGSTLTHMTGYVQPKQEWLAQMREGRFDYHSIVDLDVEVDGDTARLVVRTVTDATVYGTRADWRLQLTVDYAYENDAWIVVGSAASTW
ncbi:nuclear transport factor 2 family protein [Streptomyces albicerus]|uniref:nuclear transport factor 2 family protein n=1 Tax=Streptomyces albicerus TaxID=2569859 RepID=UPI001788E523|nr:nuclear transport factor 2 family protein [Streptomyces albicerus]